MFQFQVSFGDEKVIYDKEEKFISDLFALLISSQFSLSSLDILKENFNCAFELIEELISEQKAITKAKRANSTVKSYQRELTTYLSRLTRLSKRIEKLKFYMNNLKSSDKFKETIINQILSLDKLSTLPGFILGDFKAENTYGNAEKVSWTKRKSYSAWN